MRKSLLPSVLRRILCLTLVGAFAVLAAGKVSAAESQPVLGKAGKVLVEDDFSRAEMAPKWRPGKGSWTIQAGVVNAAENPADSHAAYAYLSQRFVYKDIVAGFSFKFDGAKAIHFMMEDSTYKESHAGHIIRASIMPTAVQLADSKYGSMKLDIFEKMKDPTTTPEEKKQIQASIKDKAATFKVDLDLTQWHQAMVEVVGDEMLLSIDGKPAGYLKSAGVDHATKNMIGLMVGGKSAELDNVKVCEASAASDWSGKCAQVLGALKK